ncbi:MAG TPA: CBS domain-containing protein [Symbiobacteriaceae bacterium]|jgi:tRNA nucleotidyltransferase (CCA-adding enzyme)
MEIIIPHINTDLDALGAAVGVQVLYPRATIVLPGATLPLAKEFISLHRYNLRVRTPREIDLKAVTQVIVVDTADPDRLGPLGEVARQAETHVFDHHPPDESDLPAVLEVRDLVGSTCTLIAELLEEARVKLTPLQATVMLLGIYSDTGSLNFTGTTDRDARAAAFLLTQGASLRAIARFIQATLSPDQVDLLHQMQTQSRWLNYRGARIRVVEAQTPEYVGGLALVVHRLQDILPAPALFAAVRMGQKVYLVGRSEVPWVDASRVMAAFGGGGHRAAASSVVKGAEADDVVRRLEAVLDEVVERPLMARDVMSSPVKAITSEKPIREAERIMLRYGHSGLPVVDGVGRLEGVVSLADVEKARHHDRLLAEVRTIMQRRVVSVVPDMPLDAVQDLMMERDIGRVPVVDEESLVGIVSRSDLLGHLYGGIAPHWHRTIYAKPGQPAGAALLEDPVEVLIRDAVEQAPAGIRALLGVAGQVAEQMGMAVYAVGGFVRDLLQERPNLDLDLVVEGDGVAYAKALGAALWATVKVVPRFGTAHIYMDAPSADLPSHIDVATARREYYEHAAALPIVEHSDLREDLYRRDFTINAMAMRLGAEGPGGLIDFYGGLADLQAGHIRILHTLSFVEDPTRILRAIRFAHRYGFALEPETEACAAQAIRDGFVERTSLERLRNELVLILQEPGSGGALAMAADLGLLLRMLPGLTPENCDWGRMDDVEQLARTVPDLYHDTEPWLTKLMYLCHGLPLPEGVGIAHRLKLKRVETQPVLHALTCWRMALDVLCRPNITPAEVVGTLTGWSPEGLLLLCLLGGTETVTRYWRIWRKAELLIDGSDLIRAGVPAGPPIGKALAKVHADLLEGRAPDKATQLHLALRYAKEEA